MQFFRKWVGRGLCTLAIALDWCHHRLIRAGGSLLMAHSLHQRRE
jgi:hypothetical protein